jgi:1-acyl-sn-glycerol-3-phosphate acyltransferase
MLYAIGKLISWVFAKLFGRLQVIGKENIPREGGVMICANHISYADPPVLGAGCPRQIHYMAKIELFQIPVLGFIIKHVGAFPVQQRTADRAALKIAIGYLAKGEVVGMFPEGQRIYGGELGEALPGVGMIVLRAKATVIPTALINTDKLLPPHKLLPKFSHIKVVYGEPLVLDDLYEKSGREAVEEVGKRIMAAIGELIAANTSC